MFYVAAVLVGAVLAVLFLWRRQEALRPELLEASVVFWVEGEQEAREDLGVRKPGEEVWAGVLLSFRQGKGPVRTLCPFPNVRWRGAKLHPEPLSAWPSSFGVVKAQWFTVEPAFFGWEGVDAASAEKLAFAEFAAPEMGSELKARVTTEAHNDDFLSEPVAGNALGGGITRVKVRVSAYKGPQDVLPWASVSSPGARDVQKVPGVAWAAALPAGIRPELARAFRCGVFTFAPGVWPDGGRGWPLSLSPREMVARHLIMTPQAVAAMAAAGDPLAEPWEPPVSLVWRGGEWRLEGRRVLWGRDLRPGDALTWKGRWAVAWGDDGSGILDASDSVLLAWMQPPRLVTLGEMAAVTSSLELRKVGARR